VRKDMAKVIVERPRIRASGKGKGRLRDVEDLPTYEGVGRGAALRCSDRKILNENLAPFRRYLAAQVGRPWNKVYSEISAHLRVSSVVQQHVRDHLRDFVNLKPSRDIHPWCEGRAGLWREPFYVHPCTGLLCRTDRLPEAKARLRKIEASGAKTEIPIGNDRELRRINGLWYEVRLTAVDKGDPSGKRALSRRYLRRYGLANDPNAPPPPSTVDPFYVT
jgi:hypothetical protein